jgi:predicted N-formylglutamate amidohydrolase
MSTLLHADEPSPIIEERRQGSAAFLIVVDHACARIPQALGSLGLPRYELDRHIALDIGALEVGRRLAALLDATLIAQAYSRLVIDCNRDPRVASSIPQVSELTEIPGNCALSAAAAAARHDDIFEPYHAHLRALIEERQAAGRRTILVALHTMTDVFRGVRRHTQTAVLSGADRRFAQLVLDGLRQDAALTVGDNEPYALSDLTDFTILRHAVKRGLPYVELEIRQDLVRSAQGQAQWSERLAGVLTAAAASFDAGQPAASLGPQRAREQASASRRLRFTLSFEAQIEPSISTESLLVSFQESPIGVFNELCDGRFETEVEETGGVLPF